MTRLLLISIVTLAAASGCHENAPQNILTVGQHKVDIIGPVASQRFAELSERFKHAIEENSEWRKYVQSSPPGEPLSYDPRCGLSKAEYDEFRKLSQTLTTSKIGEGTLSISSQDGLVYLLDGGESLPQLTGIEIDLWKNVVRTPLGVAEDCSKVIADKSSILGTWSGTKWTLEAPESDSSRQVTVQFAVGKLSDSARGVMYYRVKEGGRTGKSTILQIVAFDLPKK